MAVPQQIAPHGGIRGLIARYPLVSFFTLAFALSWIAWTPYVLGMNGLGLEPEIDFPKIMGTTQVLGVLPGAYLGPILAAFLVTAAAEGRPGLRRWAGRLLKWNVNWRWYVGAILGVPAAMILTGVALSGGDIHLPGAAVFVALLPGLVFQMVTTGLAEEPGWRDFALPYLQPKFGPLRGTLILGPLWGLWHLPLFFSEWGQWPDVTVWTIVKFIATTTLFSIVMTWVFNRSGQSLPIAMLVHTSVNNTISIAWADLFPSATTDDVAWVFLLASALAAAVVLIATRGRLGYRGDELVTTAPPVAAPPARS
ncbi:CPBP family intramembrane glutamic endopeptidase [Amycolatopsis sp. DG1A-15b]|uniref:CPBP family intramembrane glutamic endopeptidase n=1 Tax=Amycolatopsis sp. DG1A-15b TaxID=3052846 RepID=UPI00255BC2B3|nr:CPBP family intramembrane glutamic endopeptidase [Amycolatopsis sp. DG1A-15b]WIX92195.1 CPBP family intramembrane metalloprotease [Amycolatopsis sp. DG1A-15b]